MRKLLRGFINGFAGLAHSAGSEQNMRIHLVIAAFVIVTGFVLSLAPWEWIAVAFSIGLVIAAECMNTAVERLADRISLENNSLIKQAKDCSSGAVLMLAITAAVVGGIIFFPKLWAAFGW